jgi:hypothetical protein
MQFMQQPIRVCAIAAFVGALASVAAAQSLGAVAEKEESRRKKVAKPGKVYTNESLRRGSDAPPPSASPPPPPATAGSGKPAEDPKAESEPDRRKDEAHWRGRMTKAREGLDRARTFRDALQSRINALTADFTARDDPAQRTVVSNERQKAIAELNRVTAEIAAFEKEIRDIEEEARKAGVPPGWLR